MNAFEKVFIFNTFNFNSTGRAHVILADKPAGLKFKTSLHQDQSMCFLFQKKHTSLRDKAFSIKTRVSLDSTPPLRFVNTNYFNFAQELSSLQEIDCLYFQNKLTLMPVNGERRDNHGNQLDIKTLFNQTLLLQIKQNWFLGGQVRYLSQKSFSLLGFYQDSRFKAHIDIRPLEQQAKTGVLYLTNKN